MFVLAITNLLAQEVGITENQNKIWTEMEMVAFSVLVHCRKWVAYLLYVVYSE
jgi:hypothetical protein